MGAPIKSKTFKELASALYVPSALVFTKKFLFNYFELLTNYRNLNSDITLDLVCKAYISDEYQISQRYSNDLWYFFQTREYLFLCFIFNENSHIIQYIHIRKCEKRV